MKLPHTIQSSTAQSVQSIQRPVLVGGASPASLSHGWPVACNQDDGTQRSPSQPSTARARASEGDGTALHAWRPGWLLGWLRLRNLERPPCLVLQRAGAPPPAAAPPPPLRPNTATGGGIIDRVPCRCQNTRSARSSSSCARLNRQHNGQGPPPSSLRRDQPARAVGPTQAISPAHYGASRMLLRSWAGLLSSCRSQAPPASAIRHATM